ncbi:hypothetical protein ACSTHO_23675, partial [Vibrio parahaemolyticus]
KKNEINEILPHNGTFLKISELHSNIKERFADKEGFIKDLNIKLQEHYGYIIQQGFSILLNSFAIKPLELNILSVEPSGDKKKSI